MLAFWFACRSVFATYSLPNDVRCAPSLYCVKHLVDCDFLHFWALSWFCILEYP